ncbi:hypothetical protein [Pelagibius sp.]|uniref:hypothetical protein n=1 Tax=Pelagibius sp. TaxID=1931238 RepID=UPI00262EA0B3|nr:hypothetical protein [Pelagibius sp.]
MQQNAVAWPKEVEISTFRPVAYYDKHMDCIYVMTHDRSVTEHRINEFFTVHECNHRGPLDPEYVGFTIKGVRKLFKELELPLEGVYTLASLIDQIVRSRPGSIVSETLKLIYREYTVAGDLEIDLKNAA